MVSSITLPVLLLLLLLRYILGTDVLVLPLGVTREFVCTSPPEPGYSVTWAVNGILATSSQVQDYFVLGQEVHSESGGIQRILTFTAEARANNTHIFCAVTHVLSGERTVRADMNIILQGHVAAPVVTYRISSDNHSVMFSWSAPFTLNISDMEPDILHYVVYIIRDDGHNETVNITDTHYELQADPCQSHQYHVEIAAVNVVGEGEKYISPELMLKEFAVAVVSNTTVFFRNEVVVIEMTLEVSPHCHEVGMVNYEVEFNALHSDDRLLFHTSGSVGKHTVNLTSPNITVNELYDCSVRIEGLSTSESMRFNLGTFDVQHVDTNIHDSLCGYKNITCYFARGSNAKGCRIVVQAPEGATSCEFVASREEENKATVIIALPNGTYTLLVYDEEDGEVHRPTFTSTLSVLCTTQGSECTAISSDCESQPASLNYVVMTAAGGLLLFIVTSFMCLTVSTILIRREKKKAAIFMTPNLAYEEVKLKQKKRHTTHSHDQHVLTPNQDQ